MNGRRMKRGLQQCIRAAHVAVFDRGLPKKLAIYLHSLESSDHPSFEEGIVALRDLGYRFVDINEFLAESAEPTAFLSFDDNYRAWYTSLALLDRLDLTATFYVNTLPLRDTAPPEVVADYFERIHHAGERVSLSTSELVAVRVAGHAVGAHTHDHRSLAAMPRIAAKESILRCKRSLEELLGEEVHHFSYPFGMRRHFNADLLEYCQNIGFRTVASAIPGLQHGGHRSLQINRTLWRLDQPVEFNLQNVRIDGRIYERLTGRSALG